MIIQGQNKGQIERFTPVKIFPKFTKTSGSLKQNIFYQLYCNKKTNFCQAV